MAQILLQYALFAVCCLLKPHKLIFNPTLLIPHIFFLAGLTAPWWGPEHLLLPCANNTEIFLSDGSLNSGVITGYFEKDPKSILRLMRWYCTTPPPFP